MNISSRRVPLKPSTPVGVERFLFHMPDEQHAFVEALRAISSLENFFELDITNAVMMGLPYNTYQFYLVLSPTYERYHFSNPKWTVYNKEEHGNIDWGLEIYLDPARAANLTHATGKTLAEGFCIMFGSMYSGK